MKALLSLIIAALVIITASACGRTTTPPEPPVQHSLKSKALVTAKAIEPEKEEIPLRHKVAKFLEAFGNMDIETMEELAEVQPGTYKNWEGTTIKNVRIEPLESESYFGRYNISFEVVTKGLSPFKTGKNSRILVSGEHGKSSGIIAFYDADRLPLSSFEGEGFGRVMEKPELEVSKLLNYCGAAQFSSTAELKPDQMIPFVIMKMGENNFQSGGNFDSGSPTADRVKLYIWRYFGVGNLDVTQSSYYNKDSGTFIIDSLNHQCYAKVIGGFENSDGSYTVVVQSYEDPLYTMPRGVYHYKLKETDGNYMFVSSYIERFQ